MLWYHQELRFRHSREEDAVGLLVQASSQAGIVTTTDSTVEPSQCLMQSAYGVKRRKLDARM